jgi:transcriptional regulator with XRE-family HTH domain
MKKQTMGERVAELRDKYSLTQAEFAEKISVTPLSVGNIERGVTRTLQNETINRIVSVFGTTREWLEEGKGEMLPGGKKDLNAKSDSEEPWKDEAYQTLKTQNERLWEMVQRFMSGDVSFLHPVKQTG